LELKSDGKIEKGRAREEREITGIYFLDEKIHQRQWKRERIVGNRKPKKGDGLSAIIIHQEDTQREGSTRLTAGGDKLREGN